MHRARAAVEHRAGDGVDANVRLLFVGTNRGPGGTESHLVALATAMASIGCDVGAAVWPDDVVHRALAADARVVLFPAAFRKRLDFSAIHDVRRAIRSFRPHWLIGSFALEYWPLTILAQSERVPIVLFRHLRRLSRATGSILPHLVHRMIFPSEFLRNWAIERRGVPRRRTAVLYNPVDTQQFRPRPDLRSDVRQSLGFTPDNVVAGYVGRIEQAKGVHTLAEASRDAMRECPELRVLWVGHGEDESRLDAAIRSSPYPLRHVRRPWTTDVVPYYAAMDLFAFPAAWTETFGRVSAEAQACGVPVIGTRAGGIPETMDPGVSGLLVTCDDIRGWASAIVRLATDADARRQMGDAGRRFVQQRFDAPIIAREFAELLAGAKQRR